MGRSKGDANRSKNRPSSSNLAASLLQSESVPYGFGGYVGSTRIEAATTNFDNSSLDVDGELLQHLRRLSKKDSLTKLKALTSLSSLFSQNRSVEICQILPQWVFEYKRLVQDNSRQVRQAAHNVMGKLATAVGKGLAPHLKSLMGAWWLARFDPFMEVSQAAMQSFEAAFPVERKRLEALIFCQNDIFLYLEENLKLTPQTISDRRAPLEELEEMHERVVSSTLLALVSLLEIFLGPTLQNDVNGNSEDFDQRISSKAASVTVAAVERICHSHQYFKDMLKSQSSRIRCSIFKALASVVKFVPHVFTEGDLQTSSNVVLGLFQEKDPSCHSSLWDLLLLFTNRISEGWHVASVQKVVLPRLWCFLRHGCYGSQQTSYPCLLPMLSSIPSEVLCEDFSVEFFRSLWSGSSTVIASRADQAALFKAIKECFIWVVKNASRFVQDDETSIGTFHVKMVEFVILKLLWKSYATDIIGAEVQRGDKGARNGQHSQQIFLNKPCPTLPTHLSQELVNSVIDILSDLSTFDLSLVHAFQSELQMESLKVIRQSENDTSKEVNLHIGRLAQFFVMLGERTLRNKEDWAMIHIARPFVATIYPLSITVHTAATFTLLSVIISAFGPNVIPLKNHIDHDGKMITQFSGEYNHDPQLEALIDFFKSSIVKTCLGGFDYFTSSKLDLLLSFLETSYFQNQWDWIVSFVMGSVSEPDGGFDRIENCNIELLAALLDKVRLKFICPEGADTSSKELRLKAKKWHSSRLDAIAVAVSHYDRVTQSSTRQLLRSVLGGAREPAVPLISTETLGVVTETLMNYIAIYLRKSSIGWMSHLYSFILHGNTEACALSEDKTMELAYSAAEILHENFFIIRVLDDINQAVSRLLASSFLFYWEIRMLAIFGDSAQDFGLYHLQSLYENYRQSESASLPYHEESISDDAEDTDVVDPGNASRHTFGRLMHKLWIKVASSCKSFTLSTREHLQGVLVDMIRQIISIESVHKDESLVTLCCELLMDILHHTCNHENEEQKVLDLLLVPVEGWYLWIKPLSSCKLQLSLENSVTSSGEHESHVHTRFLMLIDRIGTVLGSEQLLFHSTSKFSTLILRETSISILEEVSVSRFWLVIEIFCSWRWPGGDASQTLIPKLLECARSDSEDPKQMLLKWILDIFFICVRTKNASGGLLHVHTWTISESELDLITEPFLRSLVTLLILCFKDESAWSVKDACQILDHYVLDSNFANTLTDLRSIDVVPHVLQILIPIISNGISSLEDDDVLSAMEHVQEFACNRMAKLLAEPPLTLCRVENLDVHHWVDTVVSCFPLNPHGLSKLISTVNISMQEREMLLALFRQQSCLESISENNSVPTRHIVAFGTVTKTNTEWELKSEVCLAKLIATSVGYCWKDFDASDWAFVFSLLCKWLDAAVLQIEELAESVDVVVKSPDASPSLTGDCTVEKIQTSITKLNEHVFTLGEYAVFIFSLVHELQNLKEEETALSLQLMRDANLERVEVRSFEAILRLFFATGIAESIAMTSSAGDTGGAMIAHSRERNSHFWLIVSEIVEIAPPRAREAAVRAADLWCLNKGALNALYSLMFSVHPLPSLQSAAYEILSNHPVQHIAVVKDILNSSSEKLAAEERSLNLEAKLPLDESMVVRPELHSVLQSSFAELLESDSTSQIWVKYLLGWSLFLTCVQASYSESSIREFLMQYLQDTRCYLSLLDSSYQHILLKEIKLTGLKKKGSLLASEATVAATAAKRASATGSLAFAVQTLWPVENIKIAALAGAVYGLMLRVLPAYVRDWFSSLRDRSIASAIEAFTTVWCSPALLDDEFSQIILSEVADESLSIKANRSAREISSVYRREEAHMDIVIRLPSCYPLRIVDVECTQQAGITESRQRKWMLSMAAFVRNQNGAVAEAIRFWKHNIERELEGVEDCPICYSITHTTNHSLPRMACRTCKHKFHAACIYKWFSTSNKSTCPLCQTPFR